MSEKPRISYAVRLSGYIKGFGIYLFLAILCNMAFKILPLATGLVTSYLINTVLLGVTDRVFQLLITAGLLVVATSIFSYLDVQVSHDMAYRILTQLRDKCYDKLDSLAPAASTGIRSGDVISIILGDVETLEWFYAHTIGQLVVAVIVPLSAIIFLGYVSAVLPFIVLPFIFLLICIPRFSSKKADQQGAKVKKKTGILNAVIVDGVQGLKDIISFRWQGEYFKRFFEVNKDYSDASVEYAKRSANESRYITMIMEAASLTVEAVTAALVLKGAIAPVWLMPVFVLSSGIFAPIQEALTMSTNYGLIFGAAQRVLGLLEEEPSVSDTGVLGPSTDKNIIVRFENVSFTYPSYNGSANPQILTGLDFSFRTGETVALCGASGEGKSTAARLLQRFWDVDNGRITLNGTDIREYSLEALRDMITVVPQEVYLFNTTIEDNLKMARPDAQSRELKESIEMARADTFINALPDGPGTVVGESGIRLSGGEKQRISIAQAFLKNSPVLVLDEASASLDAENERLINDAVAHLKKGRATLVIAHRISTIKSADRVIFIKNGRVFASGTYDELIRDCPEFRKMTDN